TTDDALVFLLRFLLNPLPSPFHMTRHSIGLTDAEAQSKPFIQASVGQIQIATAIQTIHHLLIHFISTFTAEANQVYRYGRSQFEAVILPHPILELLRQ